MDIPKGIIERLSKDGVTSRYLADVMGISWKVAARLLIEAGCVQDKTARYRLPGTKPPINAFGGSMTV